MSGEYPGSERHFADRFYREAPRMTKEDRVEAIRRAAVDFANDYGPLPGANRGDEAARHAVATRLVNALRRHGLKIIEQ